MERVNKYFSVFWENGLVLSKHVFLQQQNALVQQNIFQSAAHVHLYAYGLCGNSDAFDIAITHDGHQQLNVRINNLQAVTPIGIPININASDYHVQNASDYYAFTTAFPSGNIEEQYWIVLRIAPYELIPIQANNLTESNKEFTLSVPKISVECIPYSQLQHGNVGHDMLVIGSFQKSGNDIKINDQFIPAMRQVNCHPDMLQWYQSVMKVLEHISGLSMRIIMKIGQKNQQNDLSKWVQSICECVNASMNVSLPKLRLRQGFIAPTEVFECLMSIAMSVRNGIDMQIGAGKEELMNYLTEWLNITPGIFEETLSSVAHLKYDVIDTNNNIAQVGNCIATIHTLFETLDKLDFIGKKKDSGLFIKEESTVNSSIEEVESKPKRRFFGY